MNESDLEAPRVRRRVEQSVRRYALEHEMLPPGSRCLVAVSGGADSTSMLLALQMLSHRGGFSLAIAHFDHQLRGEEASAREAAFVADLALSYGLPFFTGKGDVRGHAEATHQSLEAAARDLRYQFLAKAAEEAACDRIATGHTASDQAETVLLHLVRGAGLRGLGGIAPISWRNPIRRTLIRPLLRVTRADTEAYCAAAGIEPIDDESNRSPDFARNRIRLEVLPLLRQLNPRAEDAIVRLADSAREDMAFLDTMAIQGIANGYSKDTIRYTWNKLNARDPVLMRHGLRTALGLLLGDAQDFSEAHYAALDRLMFTGRTGDRLSMPRGVIADRGFDFLRLTTNPLTAVLLPKTPVVLAVPGSVRFGGLIVEAGTQEPSEERTSVVVDAEAAGSTLVVRMRQNGDRMQPLGLGGTKKLQDLFVDTKIPRPQRDSCPIFENERGIVWVGGLRLADWAAPRPGHPIVYLSFESA